MLVGGDARFMSLYLEHHDLDDLAVWRDAHAMFRGTAADARRVLCDMAGALHHLAQLNVQHNDIKPGNVLYGRQRGAVLIDFGLASTPGGDGPGMPRQHLCQGGTPWYVAPEYQRKRRRGAPADVWALGVVMLYLLRLTPLPDSPRYGVPAWRIADVLGVGSRAAAARDSMDEWLAIVDTAAAQLDPTDALQRVVKRMLETESESRLTVEELYRWATAVEG